MTMAMAMEEAEMTRLVPTVSLYSFFHLRVSLGDHARGQSKRARGGEREMMMRTDRQTDVQRR